MRELSVVVMITELKGGKPNRLYLPFNFIIKL